MKIKIIKMIARTICHQIPPVTAKTKILQSVSKSSVEDSFILRIPMRVKFIFIFTNFPNIDLGKTFPILSDSIFLFLAGRRTR